ncbi:hypothetical protein LOTGIDRAFT_54386, partial [Lottia gigantea]
RGILLGFGLYCVVFITIAGNVLVLIAFYKEKKLRTVFNLYIVNLAITDIGVAATAMSFYIIDNILGYWPFGEFLCGFWIFCDYGMTFASVFTLIVISIDRFWSVSWSVHYRTHHKAKKSYISIAVVWSVMIVLWLPACVTDRIKHQRPGMCIWEPSLNSEFVIFIAAIGHHGSCFVLLFCYVQVFTFVRRRAKVGAIGAPKSKMAAEEISVTGATLFARKQKPATLNSIRESGADDDLSSDEASTIKREKKVFVTLSYILVGYVICWVPFHVVFDISAVKPDAVPHVVYTITFWMTYLNSTINPFLYNFSSPDFREAFRKILCRKC